MAYVTARSLRRKDQAKTGVRARNNRAFCKRKKCRRNAYLPPQS